MTSAYRITKVICPACEGGLRQDQLGGVCLICMGATRIPTSWAKHYAEAIYVSAIARYVLGTLNWADRSQIVSRAEAIFLLIEKKPSWKGRRLEAA